jgi:hypothetical protein
MRRLTVAVIAALALTPGAAGAKKQGEFFIQRANLTNHGDGSWSGSGRLDGVEGALVIAGAPDPSTDAVEFESKKGFHKLRWSWAAGRRRVAGCSRERIVIRPNGVLLWDGGGKITKTSAQERTYVGRKIAFYGPTKQSDTAHAQISIRENPRQKVMC